MMKERRARKYCIAEGCRNTDKNPDLAFYWLPNALKHAERRRTWLTLLGREDLFGKDGYYSVCGAHFDDSSMKIIRQLEPTALPMKVGPSNMDSILRTQLTAGLPQDTEFILPDTPSTSTQTQDEIIATKNKIISKYFVIETNKNLSEQQTSTSLTAPRKRKLSSELEECNLKQRRLSNETNTGNDTENEVEKRLNVLIEWQNEIKNMFEGNQNDAGYKSFALNLFYSSPHAYRCLQTVLKLPSVSTLNGLKIDIPPTLDERALNSLALLLKTLPDEAKYCTICIDELTLKRNLCYDVKLDEITGFHNINGKTSADIASNAFVIMVQGIYVEWKQPIAYGLLASAKHYNKIDSWINEVITKLSAIGIEVKAIISDQEWDFDKFAKEVKNVTVEKPYFIFDNTKIYYVFDVPHLVKSIRNDLLTGGDFIYDEKIISWKYVMQLYEDQKNRNLRLIPNITDAHIYPNKNQKMKIKLAIEALSRSVAAALHTYIDLGKMPEEARPTATFIETISNLFDILNSSEINSDNKFQTAFTLNKDQEDVLNASKETFSLIKPINRKTGEKDRLHTKAFVNFQISIQSIIMLQDDLKKDGFEHLLTRRLNKDNLREFLDSVQQHGGPCKEPTPIQFTRAFSKLFLSTMIKNAPPANCEMDFCDILLKAEDMMKVELTDVEQINLKQPSTIDLSGETDYRIDFPDKNALTYVSSYLFYKCLEKHSCPDIEKIATQLFDVVIPDQSNLTSQYKAYNKNSSFYGNLKMPPQDFINYINSLEDSFIQNFELIYQNKPGGNLLKRFQRIRPKIPCSCFPVEYLLKLFARFRIFATIRLNNRTYKDGKRTKKKLKVSHL